MNILKGTKTYLIGPMQYKNGETWRDKATEELTKLGVKVFNPYSHPFINSIQEGNLISYSKQLIQDKKYDEVAKLWKITRIEDLAMCDYATFIIAYIDTNVHTTGTYEELFWSNRLKRPIFLICEQGKDKVPLWIWGTLPHKYFYNTLDEVLDTLNKINSGKIEIDSARWKILKQEFV